MFIFFFFNDTATTEIYTLSLHDALPISVDGLLHQVEQVPVVLAPVRQRHERRHRQADGVAVQREPPQRGQPVLDLADRKSTRLNSSQRQYLVCRLLLEKKKY